MITTTPKQRWQVELFFKWMKGHLRIKSFWGDSENAVRIQIYTTVTTYCLVAIAAHKLQLNRSTFDVLRIVRHSLIDKTPIKELFTNLKNIEDTDCNDGQLELDFGND